jgi:hypothetical protein
MAHLRKLTPQAAEKLIKLYLAPVYFKTTVTSNLTGGGNNISAFKAIIV